MEREERRQAQQGSSKGEDDVENDNGRFFDGSAPLEPPTSENVGSEPAASSPRPRRGLDYDFDRTNYAWQPSDDVDDVERSAAKIKEWVYERLGADSWLKASDILVEVKGEDVILNGKVPNRQARIRAEDVVLSVAGVKEVFNHLKIVKGEEQTQQVLH